MSHHKLPEIIQELKDKNWRKRGKWYHSAIFNEIFSFGESTAICERLGYPFQKTTTIWLSTGEYLDLEEEWNALRDVIEKGYKNDEKYFHNYAEHCLSSGEDLVVFSKELQARDATNLSDEELSGAYKSLIEKCQDFMPFMMSLHLVDEYLTEKFDLLLTAFVADRGLTKKDFFEYQTALTLPFRKIFILAEKEDLLALAVRMKKGGLGIDDDIIRNALEKHTEAYKSSNAYLMERLPFTTGYFRETLQKLLTTDVVAEYEALRKSEMDLRQKQGECMDQIRDFQDFYEIAEVVRVFGYLRSYRVDVLFIAYINCWNIVTEIAHRLNIDVLNSIFLDTDEVHRFLVNKDEGCGDIIEDRKTGFTSLFFGNQRYELTHSDSQILRPYIELLVAEVNDSVRGAIAYPGKIIGRCKVLHSLDDMKKVEKGDIIVISMTDPNYIPAMNLAGAFVTDQGGILCHAAIVSREMKKPCIIGTKHATKTFHDGDLVEVDAESGVVRILERFGSEEK